MTDAMIERAARAICKDEQETGYQADSWDYLDPERQSWYRQNARAALDAAMPVVDTAEALDALPPWSKVLDRNGDVWWRRESQATPWEGSGGGYGSTYEPIHAIHQRFLTHGGPLRVIWTPEVTP